MTRLLLVATLTLLVAELLTPPDLPSRLTPELDLRDEGMAHDCHDLRWTEPTVRRLPPRARSEYLDLLHRMCAMPLPMSVFEAAGRPAWDLAADISAISLSGRLVVEGEDTDGVLAVTLRDAAHPLRAPRRLARLPTDRGIAPSPAVAFDDDDGTVALWVGPDAMAGAPNVVAAEGVDVHRLWDGGLVLFASVEGP